MSRCILCGKEMGIADTINDEFEDVKKRQTCFNCHLKFIRDIKPQIDTRLKAGVGIEQIVEEVGKEFSLEGKEFIHDYIYYSKNLILGNVGQNRDEAFEKKMQSFKCTTGYNFEGYKILEYVGIVSGEVVIGTGFLSEFSASFSDLFGVKSKAFADKMIIVKKGAQDNLIKNAILCGANALIGVDFDYITFNNNILGVSANGTAVVIEKIEE